tara:strand:- start:1253 stop:1480 length:228 start_codon:yes stop_codon:yes gene_type:complete
MGFLTIFILISIILIGIYSFIFLGINEAVVHLDLLFLELDLQLGYLMLSSFLVGIFITIVLEMIFFSAKRKNKDD